MDLGEYIFMRIALALLIVAVVVGFRLIVALLGKALSYFTKSGGKNPDSKTPAQTRQPPKAPVVPQTPEVLKPPVIPQTPVTPKQPEPPKPPVTPPVQSYQPPVQSYKPPVQGYQPQQYSGTVPLDPEVANDPMFYPDEDVLANTEVFITLPDETIKFQKDLWIKLKCLRNRPDWWPFPN